LAGCKRYASSRLHSRNFNAQQKLFHGGFSDKGGWKFLARARINASCNLYLKYFRATKKAGDGKETYGIYMVDNIKRQAVLNILEFSLTKI